MIRILIDGDIPIYSISSAIEEPIDWGDGWWSLTADQTLAAQQIDQYLKSLVDNIDIALLEGGGEAAENLHVTIALSDPKRNWRRSVLPSYKENRANKRKPVLWNPLREHLIENHGAVIWPALEADDVIGILATRDSIVVSEDKDFKTIPCLLYKPSTGSLTRITKASANRFHLLQTLMGDAADGYKGCPGVGPVKADRILKEGQWSEVVKAYVEADLMEEDALLQARVAHILRDRREYKKRSCEIRLWHPSQLGRKVGSKFDDTLSKQYLKV